MSECSFTSCCIKIRAAYQQVEISLNAAIVASRDEVQPYRDIVNAHQGMFIATECGVLPTLAETSGRIHNFGGGFAEWAFVAAVGGHTQIHLPAPLPVSGIHLNAVRLADGVDYTLAGATLTLMWPLDAGDWLTAKTYGGNL